MLPFEEGTTEIADAKIVVVHNQDGVERSFSRTGHLELTVGYLV